MWSYFGGIAVCVGLFVLASSVDKITNALKDLRKNRKKTIFFRFPSASKALEVLSLAYRGLGTKGDEEFSFSEDTDELECRRKDEQEELWFFDSHIHGHIYIADGDEFVVTFELDPDDNDGVLLFDELIRSSSIQKVNSDDYTLYRYVG